MFNATGMYIIPCFLTQVKKVAKLAKNVMYCIPMLHIKWFNAFMIVTTRHKCK